MEAEATNKTRLNAMMRAKGRAKKTNNDFF